MTTGDNCEKCQEGYYGDARNGGSCQPCDCGDKATSCDATTGQCHCYSKGLYAQSLIVTSFKRVQYKTESFLMK